MTQEKKVTRPYRYEGPVYSFGRCIDNHWEGSTWATSEKKALVNLAYQYKAMYELGPASKIELDPKYLK